MAAQPERSFGRSFNRLGRLENAWAAALAQDEAPRALERVRRLYQRFADLGVEAAPLWLDFQASVLEPRFLPHLLDEDLDRLRDVGASLAAAGAFELAQTWWPLVEASAVQGAATDYQRAYRLLTDIYNAPSSRDEIKLHAAARLARFEAVGEQQLAVYADVVTRLPQPPAEVAGVVGGILNVGFDSENEQLRRAYQLAGRIGGRPRADTAFALGLGELLLFERPEVAARMFETALTRSAAHAEATRGLLSAHLHARDFRMAVAVGARTAISDPRGADLLVLCQALAWFEVRWKSTTPLLASPTPPATAARLAAINPGRDTGPWRDYALGRAYLLDGDARQAQQALAKVPEAGVTDPDVHYHLAWAHLLCQNPEGVRAGYDALSDGAGSWALGCLLKDAEPGQPLPSTPAVPEPLRTVAAARKALIGDGPIPTEIDLGWLVTPSALQPDLFEALRTALGVAVARRQASELKALLQQALFNRLPAAERLIWTALALRTSDPERSRQMLGRARDLGRDRAAVLLAHDALQNGRSGEIHELLRDVRGPKAELLTAWADAYAGEHDTAVDRLAKLSDRGLAQAGYAMALLSLRTAADEWARGRLDHARTAAVRASSQLRVATTRGMGRFEVSLLDHAARLLASAPSAEELSWQDVADQPWTARLLGLVRLVRAPESVDAQLIQSLTDWPRNGAEAAAAVHAVLRVALLARDVTARAEAARFLIQLDKRSPGTETGRAARSAAACVALSGGDDDGLDAMPEDPLSALVGAGVALDEADREEAVRRLRAAHAENAAPRLSALVAVLADALEGAGLPNQLPFEAPTTVEAALAAAAAAGQVATGNTAAATDSMLRASVERGTSGFVDLRRALPFLVQHAAKRGRKDAFATALAPIVRQATASADSEGGIGSLAAARYATVIGDFETAETAWRRALDQTPSDDDRFDELRGEYGRFLCHKAALAELDGDHAAALASVRTAALYQPERARRILEDLEAEKNVSTLLRALFPGSPIAEQQRPGRHRRLAELIAANPELRRALWAEAAGRILEQWTLATAAAGQDIELWHTLAVLAREDALARPSGQRATDHARAAATALWTVLLTEPALRTHFEQRTLPGEADDELRRELIEDLLVGQKARFTQAVAEGDLDTARICMRCLDAIRQGLAATRRLLEGGPFSAVAAAQAGGEAEFAPIAERAGRLIDEWGADLVAAAEETLTDREAIRAINASSNLDKNYGPAIEELEIVVLLGCPQKLALRSALRWGYDWWVCLHNQGDIEAAIAAIDTVTEFAELLGPHCTQGQAHVAENKALCDYYYGRGLSRMRLARTTGKSRSFELLDESCVALEQSYAWNPDEDAARRELARARGRILFKRGDYGEAERVLRDLRDNNRELAVLFHNYGIERYDEARALLRIAKTRTQLEAVYDPADEAERMLLQALRFDPGDAKIRENPDLIEGLTRDIDSKRLGLA
jgi:tetratricopeptide (TPR) repeat protein